MNEEEINKMCSDIYEGEDWQPMKDYIYNLQRENEILKHRLNDIIFSDVNDDVELGARYLRKIGYIDFDEERKVYLNKHNEEPFLEEDEREKDYYIQDKELDEYTKQLEYKLQQKDKELEAVKQEIKKVINEIDHNPRTNAELRDKYNIQKLNDILDILDKDNK